MIGGGIGIVAAGFLAYAGLAGGDNWLLLAAASVSFGAGVLTLAEGWRSRRGL